LQREAQAFIGQEATHRRLHALYNAHLERLGLVNEWGPRGQQRARLMEGQDVRHWLGITAATEHFTAILADYLLHHAEVLGEQDERLKTLWLWHSSEESEHKSTAFDLYRALGGNHTWRVRWMRRVTAMFLADLLRQTVLNLRRDGTLWQWSTWRSAARFLFGREGMLRQPFPAWRAYFRRDFHPSQQDASAGRAWLAQHADRFVPVGS
jgi:hypothetical protein